MELYPLKFKPILKDKIWGGQKLHTLYNKPLGSLPNIGESWELSGCAGDESVVVNGYLAGNQLGELIEVYMDELVGGKVFNDFQGTFPLLFKLIDAQDDLSIQVHPNDEVAAERHQSLGKTEMWIVLDAAPGASLITGFSRDTNQEEYVQALNSGHLDDLLLRTPVKAGDVVFVPAGLVHAICKGVMVAEIQETSDITYRIYDYNRRDAQGHTRQLHTAEALDVINFKANTAPLVRYTPKENGAVNLVQCDYFTTNLLCFDRTIGRDYSLLDSFVVYMCLEGSVEVDTEGGSETLRKGETLLLPASLNNVTLRPADMARLVEVYVE